MATTCSNCGAALTGRYCQQCGQKRFVDSDRRFGHLAREFVASATDLDGRVWRTLRALMLRPGLLSAEYFAGRRARWIAPASLFLAINVAYFLVPLHGSDFALQFSQQVPGAMRAAALDPGQTLDEAQRRATGRFHSRFTTPLIERRVAARDAAAKRASNGTRGYTVRDYRIAYDSKADDISKALVIVHLPLVALAMMLLLWRQRRYFAEHFVFVLHYFAFALVAVQIVAQTYRQLTSMLPIAALAPGGAVDWFVRVLLIAYAITAVHRAYDLRWPTAIAVSACMLAAMIAVNLFVYQTIEFLVTFALT